MIRNTSQSHQRRLLPIHYYLLPLILPMAILSAFARKSELYLWPLTGAPPKPPTLILHLSPNVYRFFLTF